MMHPFVRVCVAALYAVTQHKTVVSLTTTDLLVVTCCAYDTNVCPLQARTQESVAVFKALDVCDSHSHPDQYTHV